MLAWDLGGAADSLARAANMLRKHLGMEDVKHGGVIDNWRVPVTAPPPDEP